MKDAPSQFFVGLIYSRSLYLFQIQELETWKPKLLFIKVLINDYQTSRPLFTFLSYRYMEDDK